MKKDIKVLSIFAQQHNNDALLSAGYSVSELLSAGYSVSELCSAGYSASVLCSAGYSASEVCSAGYSVSALCSAGYSASEVLSAGYSVSELLSAGYSENDLKEWEEIPVLEKPYSHLLADINDKNRIHKQSTFGVIEDFDPEKNVCESAMCTAGHLVNMAGEFGYELKNKYGWANAASLIHYKSHPDYPCQNFGSIPQEWAMAYIEDMASREANENTNA